MTTTLISSKILAESELLKNYTSEDLTRIFGEVTSFYFSQEDNSYIKIVKDLVKLNWSFQYQSPDINLLIKNNAQLSNSDKEFILQHLYLLKLFVPQGSAPSNEPANEPSKTNKKVYGVLITVAATVILPTFDLFATNRSNDLKYEELEMQKEQNEIENFLKERELDLKERELDLKEKELDIQQPQQPQQLDNKSKLY
ncbi:hypothetical protein EWY05_13015 [Enterococcus faecalis]|nr:hypothetical protein [Enterococcus faecalis]